MFWYDFTFKDNLNSKHNFTQHAPITQFRFEETRKETFFSRGHTNGKGESIDLNGS